MTSPDLSLTTRLFWEGMDFKTTSYMTSPDLSLTTRLFWGGMVLITTSYMTSPDLSLTTRLFWGGMVFKTTSYMTSPYLSLNTQFYESKVYHMINSFCSVRIFHENNLSCVLFLRFVHVCMYMYCTLFQCI